MALTKLHFVYNETSNPIEIVLNFAHRIHSPDTYACKLCDVTYGTFFVKKEWDDFLNSLPVPSKFHMKNWFIKRFPAYKNAEFPAVYSQDETGNLTLIITPEEFNRIKTLDELKQLVRNKIPLQ
ncbi:MAG TPA: hypothetical protein VK174_09240 [Chitinophagales bacterium]|nr:hypothetical protein [Chitinophagales bacterium]